MYKIIKIGTADVPMEANAATPYRYKQVFHEDFLARVQGNMTDVEAADVGSKLAFILAMQGEKKDMNHVNESQFYEWLALFEPMDVINALDEVMNLYRGNAVATSTPKKKSVKQ